MAKIDINKIEQLYILAQRFDNEELKLHEALALVEGIGINKNTAVDYIYNLGHLINGRLFTRTINAIGTEYYLNRIFKDYGLDTLKKALLSLSLHIGYYENVSGSKVKTVKEILNRFLDQYDIIIDEYFGEEPEADSMYEGNLKKISVNKYERNPLARRACIDHFKAICMVCDFNFEEVYGDIGRDFIHVHHLKELSAIKKEYKIDVINDLVPVCPNCHAMLHKRKPAYTIDELRSIIHSNK